MSVSNNYSHKAKIMIKIIKNQIAFLIQNIGQGKETQSSPSRQKQTKNKTRVHDTCIIEKRTTANSSYL